MDSVEQGDEKNRSRVRPLIIAMIFFQLLWLVMIWLTGAASNWRKLPILFVYSVVVGLAVTFAPTQVCGSLRAAREYLLQHQKLLLVILSGGLLVGGSVYARYQRIWPYDEENLLVAAKIIVAEGVAAFFANYAEIPWLGRFHPPLMALVNGSVMAVLGTDLYVMRLVAVLILTATTLLTYMLGRELYDCRTGLLAALLLTSFPLILRQGTAAMLDIPVTFLFSLALMLTLRLLATPTYWTSVLIGLIIGAGLMTKYTMVFVYPVLLGFFLISHALGRLKLHVGLVVAVSVGILAAWVVYARHIGVLTAQKKLTSVNPAWFITSQQGRNFMLNSLLTKLLSGLGAYNIPLLLLGGLHLVQHRGRSSLFLLLWVGTVSILLVLTLPDHRYFMPVFPALAIMIARGLQRFTRAIDQVVALALLYCGGAMYLFVDWFRAAQLFVR